LPFKKFIPASLDYVGILCLHNKLQHRYLLNVSYQVMGLEDDEIIQRLVWAVSKTSSGFQ